MKAPEKEMIACFAAILMSGNGGMGAKQAVTTALHIWSESDKQVEAFEDEQEKTA